MLVKMTHAYPKGQVVTIAAEFKDTAGVATDPTTITARFLEPTTPTATETVLVFGVDAALVRDDVGLYHVDIVAGTVGEWPYRFEGTGAVQAVDEHVFKVLASRFASV